MDVIVFGGNGLIGSYVTADLCDQGLEVAVFGRSGPKGILRGYEDRLRWIRGDVADAEQVARAVEESGAKRIVHLAAALQFNCDKEPDAAMRINVGGTINVLEAAATHNVDRVVYASTGAAYGIRGGRLDEETAVGPEISIYGASKVLGERLGNEYAERHGFDFLALRYGMTFGPGNITSPGMAKVVQDITSAMDGNDVTIAEIGGHICRQLTYVRDAAAGTVLAVIHDNPSHRLYNVAGPDENYVSFDTLCDIMRDVVPGCGTVTFTGSGREGGSYDTTRIRKDLGFEPRFAIVDGLRAQREDRDKYWQE